MGALETLGGDGPHAAAVSAPATDPLAPLSPRPSAAAVAKALGPRVSVAGAPPLIGFPYGLDVVEVAPRSREEEDGLVRAGRAVCDRLRHRVRLRPNDLR